MAWIYFTVTEESGKTRLVVRRNGPEIQLLTPEGWVERPDLLPRFQDAGYLEEVTPGVAKAAALSNDLPWNGLPWTAP